MSFGRSRLASGTYADFGSAYAIPIVPGQGVYGLTELDPFMANSNMSAQAIQAAWYDPRSWFADDDETPVESGTATGDGTTRNQDTLSGNQQVFGAAMLVGLVLLGVFAFRGFK